jgi:hypothetical protein
MSDDENLIGDGLRSAYGDGDPVALARDILRRIAAVEVTTTRLRADRCLLCRLWAWLRGRAH